MNQSPLSLDHLESLIIHDPLLLRLLLLHHHGLLHGCGVAVHSHLLLVHDHLHIGELVRRVLDVEQRVLRPLLLVEVHMELPWLLTLLGVHLISVVLKEFLEVVNRSALGYSNDI
jgi:hypothetical protein